MKEKIGAAAILLIIIIFGSVVMYNYLSKPSGVSDHWRILDLDLIFTDNDTLTATYVHPGGGGGYGWADDNTIYVRITGALGTIYAPTTDLKLTMNFALDNLTQAGTQATPVSVNVTFPSDNIVTTPSGLSISAVQQTASAEGYFEIGNVWTLKVSNLPGTPNENTKVTYNVFGGEKAPLASSIDYCYWVKENTPLG